MGLNEISDTVDLLRPQAKHIPSPPDPARWTILKYFVSARSWYQRSILLSGRHYVELHELDITGRSEVDGVKDKLETSIRTGWKFTSLVSCILVGFCLCFNIIFMIVVARQNPPNDDGIGEIDIKDCNTASSATAKIHVAINVVASALVAASNYNMQCLTAPTRKDVDDAHERGAWLDIGIQSMRNLRSLPTWRAVLWIGLLLSSVPLHLLWNSAIFASTTSYSDYTVLVVAHDFLKSFNTNGTLFCNELDRYPASAMLENLAICDMMRQAQADELSRLSPAQCIAIYTQQDMKGRSSVVAVMTSQDVSQSTVVPPANASFPVLAYFKSDQYSDLLSADGKQSCKTSCNLNANSSNHVMDCTSNEVVYGIPCTHLGSCHGDTDHGIWWMSSLVTGIWPCLPDEVDEDGCSQSEALRHTNDWRILPDDYEIEFCLARSAGTVCKLQYSAAILYIVICCNAVKFLAISANLYFSDGLLMASVGDAVASFLQRPDPNTKGKCLINAKTTSSEPSGSAHRHDVDTASKLQPLKWDRAMDRKKRWHHGATWKQVVLGIVP